jgi:radical SAM superfamily enzyme YgiQ (UPF0313 family)
MPAPPLPGLLLAGMTPNIVDVEVLHEMVRPIDYNSNADFIAISFMDYLLPHAIEVASKFRELGKIVIGGGKFCSTFPNEADPYFDSLCIGEAQGVWEKMVFDMVSGSLQKRYYSDSVPSLDNIPPPRYDLAEKVFTTPIVTEATRSCTHSCSYCQLTIKKLPYRLRPVADVVADLKNIRGLTYLRRKTAMIYDNHLGGNLAYSKELLKEIKKLNFWAVGVQFSIECLRDDDFIDLLDKANVRMAFIGMESLDDNSLKGVNKNQNKVEEYKDLFYKLHSRGILTFTGLIFALEEDTQEYYDKLPEKLEEVGVAAILSSIAIPLYGTPLYKKTLAEGRITDFDISHYEGDHLVFRHPILSEDEIYSAYYKVNKVFFSPKSMIKRWYRLMRQIKANRSFWKYVFKVIFCSVVYFQISIFQRDHALKRVFKRKNNEIDHVPEEEFIKEVG